MSYYLDFFQPAATKESVVNVLSAWNIGDNVGASAASSTEMSALSVSVSMQAGAIAIIKIERSINKRNFDMP